MVAAGGSGRGRSIKLGEAFVEVKAKLDKYKKQLKDAEKATEKSAAKMQKALDAVAAAATGVVAPGMGIASAAATKFGGVVKKVFTGTMSVVKTLTFGFFKLGLTIVSAMAKAAVSVVKFAAGTAFSALKRFGGLIGGLIKKLPLFSLGITGLAIASLKLAADAQETANLFGVAFGGITATMEKWANNNARILGLSRTHTKEFLSTFQLFLTTLEVAPPLAAEMSQSLTRLASDIASLRNQFPERVFRKLVSGLSGEIEPLRRLGILIDDSMVKKFALARGIISNLTDELTQQQKVLIRYNLILLSTRRDAGDFQKTQDTLKNSFVGSLAAIRDLGQTIGEILSPAVNKYLVLTRDNIRAAEDVIKAWAAQNKVGERLSRVFDVINNVFQFSIKIMSHLRQVLVQVVEQILSLVGTNSTLGRLGSAFVDLFDNTKNLAVAWVALSKVVEEVFISGINSAFNFFEFVLKQAKVAKAAFLDWIESWKKKYVAAMEAIKNHPAYKVVTLGVGLGVLAGGAVVQKVNDARDLGSTINNNAKFVLSLSKIILEKLFTQSKTPPGNTGGGIGFTGGAGVRGLAPLFAALKVGVARPVSPLESARNNGIRAIQIVQDKFEAIVNSLTKLANKKQPFQQPVLPLIDPAKITNDLSGPAGRGPIARPAAAFARVNPFPLLGSPTRATPNNKSFNPFPGFPSIIGQGLQGSTPPPAPTFKPVPPSLQGIANAAGEDPSVGLLRDIRNLIGSGVGLA